MSEETFHPGKKSIAFALLFAFLSTKNGRNLAAEIINKRIKQTLLFWVPIRYRCHLIKVILSMPAGRGRKLLKNMTSPWGEQWDYITKIQNKLCTGHWIARNTYQAKKPVEWVESTVNEADLIIYYIHGGGFRMGSSLMYTESFVHIVEHLSKTRNVNARIFSIDYGMNPDVSYNRTKEDVVNGYRYLVQDLKIDPKKIIIAGDSAGGNLVAVTLLSILDPESPNRNLPLPAANVQISPWITIDNSKSVQSHKEYVDCLTPEMLKTNHAEYFLGSKEIDVDAIRHPSISPLYGSFIGFCPTLVTYGGTEIFQHDCEELIGCLKRDGVQVDVITRPDAPHIWLISSTLSPTYEMWKKDCSALADWCANQLKKN